MSILDRLFPIFFVEPGLVQQVNFTEDQVNWARPSTRGIGAAERRCVIIHDTRSNPLRWLLEVAKAKGVTCDDLLVGATIDVLDRDTLVIF
jgi:hypothetical protein